MKYAWIDKQREFALAQMCAVLDVSVSGYRAWKRGGKPGRKRLTDAQMLAADPRHSRRAQGRIRQPANGQGIAWARFPGQQGAG